MMSLDDAVAMLIHGVCFTWSGVVGPGVEPAMDTSEPPLVETGPARLLLFCTFSTALESMGCNREGLMGSSPSAPGLACKGGRGSSNRGCGTASRSRSAAEPGCIFGVGLGGGEKAAFMSPDHCSSHYDP